MKKTYFSIIKYIQKQAYIFLKEGRPGYHDHNGQTLLHPVSVENHEDYFKAHESIPTEKHNQSHTLDTQFKFLLNHISLHNQSTQDFINSVNKFYVNRGFITSKQKDAIDKITARTSKLFPVPELPNTIEEIDRELEALGRARIRPWGSRDTNAQINKPAAICVDFKMCIFV